MFDYPMVNKTTALEEESGKLRRRSKTWINCAEWLEAATVLIHEKSRWIEVESRNRKWLVTMASVATGSRCLINGYTISPGWWWNSTGLTRSIYILSVVWWLEFLEYVGPCHVSPALVYSVWTPNKSTSKWDIFSLMYFFMRSVLNLAVRINDTK